MHFLFFCTLNCTLFDTRGKQFVSDTKFCTNPPQFFHPLLLLTVERKSYLSVQLTLIVVHQAKKHYFGSAFLFGGAFLEPHIHRMLGSRRLGNIVEMRAPHSVTSFLLISFGRVVKNSYQLFFPRLPLTRTKQKTSSKDEAFLLCGVDLNPFSFEKWFSLPLCYRFG